MQKEQSLEALCLIQTAENEKQRAKIVCWLTGISPEALGEFVPFLPDALLLLAMDSAGPDHFCVLAEEYDVRHAGKTRSRASQKARFADINDTFSIGHLSTYLTQDSAQIADIISRCTHLPCLYTVDPETRQIGYVLQGASRDLLPYAEGDSALVVSSQPAFRFICKGVDVTNPSAHDIAYQLIANGHALIRAVLVDERTVTVDSMDTNDWAQFLSLESYLDE